MLMRVTGGSLNVREKPTTESEIKHILADGEEITVGKEENGWYRFGSGYVMAMWLVPVAGEDPVPPDDLKAVAKDLKQAADEIKDVTKDIKSAAKATKAVAKKTPAKKKTTDK